MIIAAALAGALVMAGLVLLAAELTRRAPAPGVPPGPRPGPARIIAAKRRIALGVLAGLVILAVTRWPVAALSATAGVIFVPTVTASREARRRTAVLEGLEQWARQADPTC